MCKFGPLTALFLLAVITVTRCQYFDILQGLQQLFQPYQQGSDFNQYNGVTRNPGPNRQTNKKKNNNRQNIKNQPINQYDYIFATTQKPSRKNTKSNSSQSNSNSRNLSSKNQYSNLLLGNYFTPIYEVTTKTNKVNKVKTTTTEANYFNNVYNDINRATTENILSNTNNRPYNNLNVNRPTENVFENKNYPQNFAVNNYETTGNINYNQNNRRPDNNRPTYVEYNNNSPRIPNNRDSPQNTNNNQYNNNNNNNRGILNTDYVNDFPSLSPSNRDPNINNNQQNNNRRVSNNNRNNNFGSTTNGFINTDNNQRFPNNFDSNVRGNNNQQNNRGIVNNNRNTNNFGSSTIGFGNSENERGFPNNVGNNAGFDTYNRGNPISGINPNVYDNTGINYNTNNRPNNFNTNTNPPNNFNNNNRPSNVNINDRDNNNNNNRGNTNNFERPTFVYPSDNPVINRPGVKPTPVEFGQPPITNKPVTENHNFLFPRPTDPRSVTFTEGPDAEPDILIGPDEDDMSDRQKRRYVDLAEKMCDSYKALSIKTVVALPLVPSPDPVKLNVSTCIPINVPLVIGGKVVNIRDFPHMALVGWMKNRNNGYSWKCGGSLISNQYILTAGHCTYQDKDYDVVSGPPQAVQLGSSYLDDPGALVVKISAVIRHPKYKQRRSYHDIALIKMVSKVTFSEVISPACLGVPPPEGGRIIATGWGRTEFGGDHSVELRSVSLPIWNMEECKEIWGTSLKLPQGVTPDSHVCAGEKTGGKDTCQGDSGGPAQVQEGCTWRVVAVTSFGRSCGAPHTPALYAVIPRAFVAAQVFADQN